MNICECGHRPIEHRYTSDTVWDNDYSDTSYEYYECEECDCKMYKETKTITVRKSEYDELKEFKEQHGRE